MDSKADEASIENLLKQLEGKTDKQEMYILKQDLVMKANKADIDMYVLAV